MTALSAGALMLSGMVLIAASGTRRAVWVRLFWLLFAGCVVAGAVARAR